MESVTIPLQSPADLKIPAPEPILQFLNQNQYKVKDYSNGLARDPIAGVDVPIDKVLKAYKAPQALIDAYNNEAERRRQAKFHADHVVVIKKNYLPHEGYNSPQQHEHHSRPGAYVAYLAHYQDEDVDHPIDAIDITHDENGKLTPLVGGAESSTHGAFHHTVNMWINSQNEDKDDVGISSEHGDPVS